ncbi:MAG: hypothetical protein A2268_05125 [Candidatus Raymondbacteria bacterium RifOxyA12_full_50_37]|uniref:Outer membrane protein beta-barrel domain-containing protein n=1 Tax=Candidatus Raymondbacteria bacterium RIFOXYD12_FULL_49_13 TaxID=1817890 RepID=A0A1F7FDA8_UNCRA|nr:MAG: hypothetical protein A2248_10135 [Candidatus Raymondbacteria bacterium RIFOXYA2_FULL_49_16]OGJ88148.1 MAG: hypothetical protein A2268_05125 [Candidatus Raymondbacteria bacterium RifOxyA12_full_50_37]OGJ93641.1 MAG: hypothetical protein A2350_06630 [Candidatus Raymondbacteria bacterium RifOxyB12_full_50_8]OGJ96950.1 MAG: hypothetical protein A2453_04930 [Candidatus Raymondbacteria bacterium RIFOXYC2_FULL_50_21]OGK04675.1 MAG: hypothetical protein A2519_21100 [Candidatus Raymondbacteria b
MIIFIVIALLSVNVCYSKICLIANGGLNLSSLYPYNIDQPVGALPIAEKRVGYNLCAKLALDVNNIMSLETGVSYETRGIVFGQWSYKGKVPLEKTGELSYNLHYIALPINSKIFILKLTRGPFVCFGLLFGYLVVSDISPGNYNIYEYTNGVNVDAILNVGYQVSLIKKTVLLFVEYDYGLTDVYKKDAPIYKGRVRNRNIKINVGWQIMSF